MAALTDDGVGDGDLEPHAVSDLQARVWQLHDTHHGAHVTLHRQRRLLQFCKAQPLPSALSSQWQGGLGWAVGPAVGTALWVGSVVTEPGP